MSRAPFRGVPPDVAPWLKAAGDDAPESEAVRRRVVGRARAAVAMGIPRGHARDGRSWRGFSPGKAAAAIVLSVGLTAAAYEVGYRRSKATEVSAPTVAPPPAPVPAPAEAAPLVEATSELEAVRPVEPPPEPMPPPPRRPAKSRPLAASAPASLGDAYAAELRLLRPAQTALGRSSFASALALVDEHQRRFPSGHLAEEREALRVKALLGLDRREEARRAAASFRGRFPQSALLARLEEMLGTDP